MMSRKIRVSMITSIINSVLPGDGSIPNAVRVGSTTSMYRRKHTCIWLSVGVNPSDQPRRAEKPNSHDSTVTAGGTYKLR